MIVYLDTSAVVPLVKLEARTEQITSYLDDLRADGSLLVSTQLLRTELHRVRRRSSITAAAVDDALSNIDIAEFDAGDLRRAELLEPASLGTLDALHLAAALKIGVSAMITLDQRLAEAAELAGIDVLDTSRPRELVTGP